MTPWGLELYMRMGRGFIADSFRVGRASWFMTLDLVRHWSDMFLSETDFVEYSADCAMAVMALETLDVREPLGDIHHALPVHSSSDCIVTAGAN